MNGVLMMARNNIEFIDNTPAAKKKIEVAGRAGMLAAVLTIERYVKGYSRKRTGATRDSYSHAVEMKGNEIIGAVGSDMMNGIYEEYGTGEFAEKGDGRKGGWVYFDPVEGKFIQTYGKKPNKPLRRGARVARKEVQDILGKHYTMEFGGR